MSNSTVTVDVAPGYYLENQTINVTFNEAVESVAINKDGTPPSISKLIAYDNLVPPRPFIAITEDGTGRVVYDGSFPKLYNSQFDVTTGSRKYLFNAIEWIMDSNRDRKILFLGDANSGESYSIKGTASSGFITSINKIINTGGYTGSVVKTASDYTGNRLDARYSELAQYGAVFIVGSTAAMPPRMTDRCRDDIVRYRESGGGLLLMSDSSPHLPTIQDAINHGNTGAGGHYSGIINKVATRFGAWMTDLVNRPNVPVKYIRDNFGDHPLYDGIGDNEVLAGGSDSIVRVTSDPVYPPDQVQSIYTTVLGYNVINIMVITRDGELIPFKLEYTIVDYNVEIWLNGQRYSHGQIARVGVAETVRVEFRHVGTDRAMAGSVLVDEVSVGSINKTVGQPLNYTSNRTDRDLDGEILHINNDTVITLRFTNPLGLESSIRVDRDIRTLATTRDLDYPKYDQVLQSLTTPPTTPPGRLQGTLQARDTCLDLPRVLDASKLNLASLYGTYGTVFRVGVAVFMAPQQYYGWYHHNGNRQGTCTPELDQGTTIRDINSPTDRRLELQLGYYRSGSLPTLPVAIYIDGYGPLYKTRDTTDSLAHRHWYGNGVFDIYTYLQSHLNQTVEFKFVYPSSLPPPLV